MVTFQAADLLKNFAMTQTELVLYLDPYALAANDSAFHVIRLNLADYADLITDLKVPGGSGNGDSDKPVTPDKNPLPNLPDATAGKR